MVLLFLQVFWTLLACKVKEQISALDKGGGVLIIIQRYFFLFLSENIYCDPLQNCFVKTFLMMVHSLRFHGIV